MTPRPDLSDRHEEVQLFEAEHYISEHDTDGSKTLSKKELATVYKAQAQYWMSQWDLNKDGELDKVEVQKEAFPLNKDLRTPPEIVDEEIRHLMQNLMWDDQTDSFAEGDEKDWQISKEQAKKHMEYFVAVHEEHAVHDEL